MGRHSNGNSLELIQTPRDAFASSTLLVPVRLLLPGAQSWNSTALHPTSRRSWPWLSDALRTAARGQMPFVFRKIRIHTLHVKGNQETGGSRRKTGALVFSSRVFARTYAKSAGFTDEEPSIANPVSSREAKALVRGTAQILEILRVLSSFPPCPLSSVRAQRQRTSHKTHEPRKHLRTVIFLQVSSPLSAFADPHRVIQQKHTRMDGGTLGRERSTWIHEALPTEAGETR